MRKLLLMIFLICINLYGSSNAILANVGTMPFGNFELSFEKKFSRKFSLSSFASYYNGFAALVRIYSLGYQASLGVAPKFHLYGISHENSVYIAPTLKLGYLTHPAHKGDEGDKSFLIRTGAVFGYSHVFNNIVMLDINGGLEHYQTTRLDKSATRFQNENPLMIRFVSALSLGIAF